MGKLNSLNEIIKINENFKTSVNLYLSLNKRDKVLSYIPTRSSADLLNNYLNSVINNKENATILVGPYGKGKSHLLLVLLAILTLDRNENDGKELLNEISKKFSNIKDIGEDLPNNINYIIQKKKKFLPVLIRNINNDLNQSFLIALNEALDRNNLSDLMPDTYFSIAEKNIINWKKNYINTYNNFEAELRKHKTNAKSFIAELKQCSKEALDIFIKLYPKITSGSKFNPLADSDVLPLYRSISEKLVEDYDYSGIYIIFDEFSKFIESQDNKASGNNMKLLQDICELANDSANSQVFFTMVAHKSIKEYGKYLSADIINSFTGIEGRIIEKYFITSFKNNYELIKNAILKDENKLKDIPNFDGLLGDKASEKYYQIPIFKTNFDVEPFKNTVLKGCYPLNPITSYLLLNISEKVAQNERTLFSFISNNEPNSMAKYIKEHTAEKVWFIGANLIYDYFSNLFKKEITNEYIHGIWLSAEYSLTKCKTNEEKSFIKTLAIFLIVNKPDEIPTSFKYLSLALNYNDVSSVIKNLEDKELIYKKGSTDSYVFKTRAGSELRNEIKKQLELKGDNFNYSLILENITGKHFVIPRKYNSIKMMTRYFKNEFMNTEVFLNTNKAETLLEENDYKGDGKVITLFSFNTINQNIIIEHILKIKNSKLVFVCPNKKIEKKNILREYEILQELRDNQTFIDNNEIVKKELPLLEEDIIKEVNDSIEEIYLNDSDCKVLYFDGKEVITLENNSEEEAVNNCCNALFNKTSIINNELINKHNINTSQTKKARLNIIQAILNHVDNEDFYAGTNQEATIYRSLFLKTKLKSNEHSNELKDVLRIMNKQIESSSSEKKSLRNMIEKLIQPPYGMRKGLLPIYFAYALSKRNEDIVVYFNELETQLTADIVVNMCEKPDDYALYISKEDIEKEKYIENLNKLFEISSNRNLTDNRIKNIIICMQRWFRALPQVTRNATDFDKYGSNSKTVELMNLFRKHLQKAEVNPFELLFVLYPQDFNTNNDLENSYNIIEKCKYAFDKYFSLLEEKLVNVLYDLFDKKKKLDLYHTLKEWYEKQSDYSKQGLHNGNITAFMNYIDNLKDYDDSDIANKIAKIVTDIYVENWSDSGFEIFLNNITSLKKEVEALKDENSKGKLLLSFVGRNGKEIRKNYDHVNENTGSILRNILEDTLDEYDDLSVNDRVSILLDMIERVIK